MIHIMYMIPTLMRLGDLAVEMEVRQGVGLYDKTTSIEGLNEKNRV
jgi:hypothetical protein